MNFGMIMPNQNMVKMQITRLMQKAQRSLEDVDQETNYQIVFNCYNNHLRRKALLDDLDWNSLITASTAIEFAENHYH